MDNSNSRTKYDSAEWSKNCDVCSFVQLTSLPKRKGWETTELFKSKCPNCLGFISFWQKDRVRDGASILLDVRAGLWVQHLLYPQHRHRASPCPIFRCRMPFIPQTLSGCFLKKQILRWRFVCCRKSIRKYSKEKKNKNSQRIREAGLAKGGVTAEAATQELCSEWLLGIFQQVEGLCVLPWIVIRGWPLLGTECKLVWDDCLWQKAMPREGLSFELSAAETQCLEMTACILNGSSGRHTTLPATAPLQRGFHCVQRPCLIYLSLRHSAELALGPTRSE